MRILLNFRFATILAVLFLFIIALIPPGFAFSTDQLSNQDQTNEPAKVFVGIYVLDIGMLDMSTGSYTIDFYIDLVSDRPYSIDNIEFMNGYVNSVTKILEDPYEKMYRIQASLFTNVDLQNYPFDKHKLPIEIEDRINTTKSLIYVFDAKNSSIDSNAALVGWQLKGYSGRSIPHFYSIYNETYSRFVFDVDIRRTNVTSGFKLLLPVFLIILVSLLSLLFKGDRVSTRITVNSTMLLATILLHLRMQEGLPSISYFTFADEFMVLTYVILIAVLISGVLLALYYERKDYQRANDIYKYSLRIIPVITIASYIVLFSLLFY